MIDEAQHLQCALVTKFQLNDLGTRRSFLETQFDFQTDAPFKTPTPIHPEDSLRLLPGDMPAEDRAPEPTTGRSRLG
jgi:hypothetical protein